MEHMSTSSTSTSTVQQSLGPDGSFFRDSISQMEGLGTSGFPRAAGWRRFPHISIPFNYNTDINEEGREADQSQTRNVSPEFTHPEATSNVMPPNVTTSYPTEVETYEVRQTLAQQHFTHTSPQTSTH